MLTVSLRRKRTPSHAFHVRQKVTTSARTETAGLRSAAASPTRRWFRRLATLLLICGLATIAWTATVWVWQDPFTALYTWYEQRKLSSSLERQFADPLNRIQLPRAGATSVAAEERAVAAAAARYRRSARVGQAIGRIDVPRLGLRMVLVNGTDHDSLEKGPGRDRRTFMPGEGRLVYVAGHRTTYLAPFAHIERLRAGDRIRLEMPYATVVYAVTRHRIVAADDLSVLRSHGREAVELQACHPRFFATHRYIVYGQPVRIVPRGTGPFTPAAAD
jgi:sortase A